MNTKNIQPEEKGIKSICVYCGSSHGLDPVYKKAAIDLGKALAVNDISLVYGGGKIGLMGELADSVLQNGGKVYGFIPRFLFDKEVGHRGLTDLTIVETMHERKAAMISASDGFITLPGGFGTLEEIFEAISWGQLQLHQKPSAFFNINGYYNDFRSFVNKAVAEGFIDERYKGLFCFENSIDNIINFFTSYVHPYSDKALDALTDQNF